MKYSFDGRGRRSIRLAQYDYAQNGAYFITICVHDRESLFGEIEGQEMKLNAVGAIVQECWNDLPRHYANVELDEFVAMPNHVHGIIILNSVGAQHAAPLSVAPHHIPQPAPPRINVSPGSLGAIVRSFKSAATKRINEMRATPGVPVWQRNYYEHVVRDDDELDRIRQYIMGNPAQWALDRENPAAVGVQHAEPYRATRPE